jgi:hypothetical protein
MIVVMDPDAGLARFGLTAGAAVSFQALTRAYEEPLEAMLLTDYDVPVRLTRAARAFAVAWQADS